MAPTGDSTISEGTERRTDLAIKDQRAWIRSMTLINQLTFSNNIQIQSMSYDIDDKTDLYTAARELWFEKATQKASELGQPSQALLSINR
jgi:hypothetical protein